MSPWRWLLLLAALLRYEAAQYVENDDFCDDLVSGEDERHSAACTGLVPALRLKFLCGPNNSTQIPLSRVGDGVCDCCDGSDEMQGEESGCPDVCAKQQMDAKMEALSWHRYVQTGARKRQEMVNSMRRKKTREVKNLETLRQDFTNVRKVSLDLRYWLRYEESRETSRHFELLRERELRCITGFDVYCDYWQPVFLSDDEMWVKNAPEGYMASTRGRVSKSKSQRETDYRASLSALERVRGTTCDAPDIIPDETLKIHTTAGEYLAFQTTPGGVSMRKRGPKQHRRDTFFVKFLESGPNGPVHGLLALGEAVSLVLLPVSLPLYGLYHAFETAWDYAWQSIETCAERSISSTGTGDEGGEGGHNHTASSSPPAFVVQLCVLANQTTVPGTVPFEVVQALDYTTYSYSMHLMDKYISPALRHPYMVARLMFRAPVMYLDYYVWSRFLDLPPTRNTCLLRTALQAVDEEVHSLRTRIQEESDLLLSLAEAEAELGGVAQVGGALLLDAETARLAEQDFLDIDQRMSVWDFITRRSAEKSQREQAAKEARARASKRRAGTAASSALVDYGEGGEYEALKNLCVSRELHGLLWEVCFFKRVTAGSEVVGTWSSWGPLLPLPSDYDDDNAGGGEADAPTTGDSDGSAAAAAATGVGVGNGGIGGAMSWLGGLAGAMRGVRVDKVQVEFQAKRKATRGYWQHQSYAGTGTSAVCNGSSLAALAIERWEKEQVRLQLQGGKAGFGSAADGEEDEEEEEEEDEFAMTPNGPVRKRKSLEGEGDTSTTPPAAESATAATTGTGTGRRVAEVRLRCGHDTAIVSVSALEADPCAAELVVECPMACDSREERLSLARLDELGVFGFTKRSSAQEAQERHLEKGGERRRETSKRLQEQQGRTGDIQKQKEEEALKAAALDRRKKALGKLAANSLKKLEEEEQQAELSGDRDKKDRDKSKGKDKDKKKRKDKKDKKRRKKKKKGKKRGESKDKEEEGGGGHLEMDVVEGVPEGEREDGKGSADMSSAAAPAPSLDDESSEADLFDSLPDDDEEEQEEEQEGEVIELAVGSSGEARPDTKQVGDDPSLKLVGGMARPVDMPLNN